MQLVNDTQHQQYRKKIFFYFLPVICIKTTRLQQVFVDSNGHITFSSHKSPDVRYPPSNIGRVNDTPLYQEGSPLSVIGLPAKPLKAGAHPRQLSECTALEIQLSPPLKIIVSPGWIVTPFHPEPQSIEGADLNGVDVDLPLFESEPLDDET